MKRILVMLCGLLLVVAFTGCDEQTSPAAHSWEGPGRHVVAFTSNTCAKCKSERPQLMQLRDDGTDVTELDYYENTELAKSMGVHSLPHYFVYEDGRMVKSAESITVILVFLKAAVFILYWLLF